MNKIKSLNLFILSAVLFSCLISYGYIIGDDQDASGESNIDFIREKVLRADSLIKVGLLESALPPVDSAVILAREKFGSNDTLLAHALNVKGKLQFFMSDYNGCRSSWQEALDVRISALGFYHELTAASLNNLGALAKTIGEFTNAESLYNEVLEIRLKVQGENHPDLAGLYTNLGSLKRIMGKFAEAESLYHRAYGITETSMGSNHPLTAGCLNNIAVLFEEQGRYETAEMYYLRALQIRSENLGESHPQTASSLNNLANLHYNQKKYASAETLYAKALSIRKQVYGENHLALTSSLNNLAILYTERGDYQNARELYLEALEIKSSKLPENHPLLASSYDNLGTFFYNQGIYDTAEIYYNKSLDIYENSYNEYHPYTLSSRLNLAQLHAAIGKYNQALDEYIEVNRSRREFINDVFSYASEKHKLQYLDKYPLIDNKLLALALMLNSEKATAAAGEMILGGKAAVIDAICAEKATAVISDNEDISHQLTLWKGVNNEISTLVLTGADYLSTDMYKQKVDSLYALKDSLELELSRNYALFDYRTRASQFRLEDIVEILPENTVLWEFVKFKDYDFRSLGSEKQRTGELKYTVFTIDHNGRKTLLDLGEAELIDSLIGNLRKMIYNTNNYLFTIGEAEAEIQIKKICRELCTLVFEPLIGNSSDDSGIFISPDGELNLLPFDILVTGDDEYVIEKYKISYLSSGRDLLKYKTAAPLEGDIIIVADPDFDCPDKRSPDAKEGNNVIDFISHQRGTDADYACLDIKFQRLPYTRVEAEKIKSLLTGEDNLKLYVCMDNDASESYIKSYSLRPAVLHMASHGYFCTKDDISNSDSFLENPLLRSGLALANANCLLESDKGRNLALDEDGILTAFEASALNLESTELVVLSACETGIGQVEAGEGVFGLRRAFQHAGAQSILMSVWKIQEAETCELMESFYQALINGKTKKEALRDAAIGILNSHRNLTGNAHPYFWGGFVLFGNPN